MIVGIQIRIFSQCASLVILSTLYFAGDSMVNTDHIGKENSSLHGMPFSTYDQNNDPEKFCGSLHDAGWWFKYCYISFLNGLWGESSWRWPWYPVVLSGVDVRGTVMMIRPNLE